MAGLPSMSACVCVVPGTFRASASSSGFVLFWSVGCVNAAAPELSLMMLLPPEPGSTAKPASTELNTSRTVLPETMVLRTVMEALPKKSLTPTIP